MWGMFFAASLVAVVLLYLVGFLLLKAFRFPALFAIAGAPIISTLCYEVLAIGFDKAGASASWASLFFPSLVVAGVAMGVSAVMHRRRNIAQSKTDGLLDGLQLDSFGRRALAAYVAVGLTVGWLVFVRLLDGPECFNQTYDNLTHLGLVRSFVESGHYSALTATQYRDLGIEGSYYPAAWHMIAAMVSGSLGVSNLMATNAMNYACCALVYPISCLCLLRSLFPQDKRVVIAGAIACVGFVTFPWFFVVYGVLEANLFGFIMVPVMLVSVLKLCGKSEKRTARGGYLAYAALSVAFCFVAQPNAFFTVMLFAIPYLAWRIWDATGPEAQKPKALLFRIGLVVAFLIGIFAFWYVCYKAPFLYDVTHFVWEPGASKSQALINTILFSNTWSPAAPVIALLTVIGVVVSLKQKTHLWLVVALMLGAGIYWVGVCFEGRIDQFLTGFWYSDWRRTAALQAMIAVPLAAVGIAWTYKVLSAQVGNGAILRWLGCSLLFALLFFPNFVVRGIGPVETPFGYLADMLDEYYAAEQHEDEIVFATTEQNFAKQVKEIVGDDIVYNLPYDGSMFAYQVDGIRTVHRSAYTGRGHNDDEKLIQSSLYEYSGNTEVQAAVEKMGVKYVMLLDYGHEPYHRAWPEYYPDNWKGLTAITESTPGFELLLSEGDMRLFRIVE